MDPGQATLVDAIRSHHDGIPASMTLDILPANPSKNQKRRHNLEAKLAEKNRTHFSLTNAHWQVTCGRKMAASRSEKLIKTMELQPAIDLLAQHTSKVSTSTEYLYLPPCPIGDHGDHENTKFYRKEQLAAHQLSKDLFSGCTGPSLLVWGDGGFGPTFHGSSARTNNTFLNIYVRNDNEWGETPLFWGMHDP